LQRDVPASPVERSHVEEPSPQRRGADQSMTEATVGIRRTSADGTVTDVQTGARGIPGILAQTHLWVVALVVVVCLAALLAMFMVVRELRPDSATLHETRSRTERTERFERSDHTCELIDR